MSKLVLLLSLLGITILFSFGLTDPNNPVVWLASTSQIFAFLRLGMMIALAALLVTHPPRNIYLRYCIGIFAAVLASWALFAIYNNQMKLLDSLSILEFSVSAGLIVLESKRFPVESEEERVQSAHHARLVANS
jgi:thiol:disulfide interchange protein